LQHLWIEDVTHAGVLAVEMIAPSAVNR
jgi:hypothetical protein